MEWFLNLLKSISASHYLLYEILFKISGIKGSTNWQEKKKILKITIRRAPFSTTLCNNENVLHHQYWLLATGRYQALEMWLVGAKNNFTLNLNFHIWLMYCIRQYEYMRSRFQSCPTRCDPMDWSPWDPLSMGILQARTLEWVAMPSARGSSWLWVVTHVSHVSCAGRQVLYH